MSLLLKQETLCSVINIVLYLLYICFREKTRQLHEKKKLMEQQKLEKQQKMEKIKVKGALMNK